MASVLNAISADDYERKFQVTRSILQVHEAAQRLAVKATLEGRRLIASDPRADDSYEPAGISCNEGHDVPSLIAQFRNIGGRVITLPSQTRVYNAEDHAFLVERAAAQRSYHFYQASVATPCPVVVPLHDGDVVLPMCHAGQNRSQALYLAANMLKLTAGAGITVLPPHGLDAFTDAANLPSNWQSSPAAVRDAYGFIDDVRDSESDPHFREGLEVDRSLRLKEPTGLAERRMYTDFFTADPDVVNDDATLERRVRLQATVRSGGDMTLYNPQWLLSVKGPGRRLVVFAVCRAGPAYMRRVLLAGHRADNVVIVMTDMSDPAGKIVRDDHEAAAWFTKRFALEAQKTPYGASAQQMYLYAASMMTYQGPQQPPAMNPDGTPRDPVPEGVPPATCAAADVALQALAGFEVLRALASVEGSPAASVLPDHDYVRFLNWTKKAFTIHKEPVDMETYLLAAAVPFGDQATAKALIKHAAVIRKAFAELQADIEAGVGGDDETLFMSLIMQQSLLERDDSNTRNRLYTLFPTTQVAYQCLRRAVEARAQATTATDLAFTDAVIGVLTALCKHKLAVVAELFGLRLPAPLLPT